MKKSKKKESAIKKQLQRVSLMLILAVIVFCVLWIAILLAMLLVALMIRFHVFQGVSDEIRISNIMLVVALTSLVMGAALVILLGMIPQQPINKFIDGLNSLAEGNFKTRLHYKGTLANHPTIVEITDSFNKLAGELEQTEMLRSDFINNFSHEFKTPIVSISGFAKLLQKGNLTEEQKLQYLNAIEEESMRLSSASFH